MQELQQKEWRLQVRQKLLQRKKLQLPVLAQVWCKGLQAQVKHESRRQVGCPCIVLLHVFISSVYTQHQWFYVSFKPLGGYENTSSSMIRRPWSKFRWWVPLEKKKLLQIVRKALVYWTTKKYVVYCISKLICVVSISLPSSNFKKNIFWDLRWASYWPICRFSNCRYEIF